MNALEILNVVTDKNTKDWGQVNVGAVHRKLFPGVFSLNVLLWERSPVVWPSILDTRESSDVFSGVWRRVID
jgi:hypothetical protein